MTTTAAAAKPISSGFPLRMADVPTGGLVLPETADPVVGFVSAAGATMPTTGSATDVTAGTASGLEAIVSTAGVAVEAAGAEFIASADGAFWAAASEELPAAPEFVSLTLSVEGSSGLLLKSDSIVVAAP